MGYTVDQGAEAAFVGGLTDACINLNSPDSQDYYKGSIIHFVIGITK